MNLCTRLGARSLPWAEIAAFRFLIGAAIAVGLATLRGTSLRVTDRPGILAVARPPFASALPVAGVATLGAFFYALAMIWLRRIGPAESHEAVVLHFSLVALGTMVLLALPRWSWPDSHGGLFLLGAGVGGGGAQLAMTRAYSLQRAAPVTALSNLGIVFTHLLAIPVFAERPGVWQYTGAVLVIGATALVAASVHPGREA